jgi:hypothetical protein
MDFDALDFDCDFDVAGLDLAMRVLRLGVDATIGVGGFRLKCIVPAAAIDAAYRVGVYGGKC